MQHKNEGVNRTNYTPANNEKHLVHYKAELPRHNSRTGLKESHPEILKTGLKLFPSVKRNLEKQGYVIEIIYHPNGEYNTPLPIQKVDAKDQEIAALRAALAEKEAQLAEAQKIADAAPAEAEAPVPEPAEKPAKEKTEAKNKKK